MNQYRPTLTRNVNRMVAEINATCGQGHTYRKVDAVPNLGCPVCLSNYLDKGGSLDQCEQGHIDTPSKQGQNVRPLWQYSTITIKQKILVSPTQQANNLGQGKQIKGLSNIKERNSK